MSYVQESNRLYVWNGTGWFEIALVNTNPTITAGGQATYELNNDGTPTVITLTANDPEEVPLTWSYAVSSGALEDTTITNVDNVFTITPGTIDATFNLTFTASDGVNIDTSVSSFTLTFAAWVEQAKIVSSDLEAGDFFGHAFAIDGDTVVVGAYDEDTGVNRAGAAYIFTRSGTTWTQQAKLQASDKEEADIFGRSVAISGNTVVVGAPFEDVSPTITQVGAAYIFTRSGTTWTQQAKITSSDRDFLDQFGERVAIDGDTVVVGAPGDNSGSGTSSGAAYIFTRSGTTWTQQAKITASDPQQYDNFGRALAISGSTIVVGAPYEDTGSADAGAVYVFLYFGGSSWQQQAKIQSFDALSGDNFGGSVDIEGDTMIVGASGADSFYVNCGAAYIYTRSGSTWAYQQKLVGSNRAENDGFGGGVAISGSTIVVGANGRDTGFANAGAGYIFIKDGTTWTEQAEIQPSDRKENDYFIAGAISGDTVVGGYTGGNGFGAAYIFVPA
jgi:drug/metabolite transporter superfamily protein YnfA